MPNYSPLEQDQERRGVQRRPSGSVAGQRPVRDLPTLLRHLQRSAGNQAVNHLLRQYAPGAATIQREDQEDDDDTSTGTSDQPVPSPEPTDDQTAGSTGDGGAAATQSGDNGDSGASTGDGGDTSDQQVALSGEVAPIEDPDPLSKVGCDRANTADLVASPSEKADHPGTELRIDADLAFDYAQHRVGGGNGPGKADSVKEGLSVGSTVAQGGVTLGAHDFGDEQAEYKADTISWTRDAAAGSIKVVARMFLDIHWDTQSLGNTGVAGANDPAVTAGTWKDIVKDLKPDGTGRPTRDTYWAPDLTAKHEKFHASDDIGQATLFLPTVKTWLNSQTIAVPAGPDPTAAIETKVKDLVEQARQKVKADGWAHYSSGGEDRAYADGKSSYQARVDAISARAGTEKWA